MTGFRGWLAGGAVLAIASLGFGGVAMATPTHAASTARTASSLSPVRPGVGGPGGELAACDATVQGDDPNHEADGDEVCYGEFGDEGRPLKGYTSHLTSGQKTCLHDAGVAIATGVLGGLFDPNPFTQVFGAYFRATAATGLGACIVDAGPV